MEYQNPRNPQAANPQQAGREQQGLGKKQNQNPYNKPNPRQQEKNPR